MVFPDDGYAEQLADMVQIESGWPEEVLNAARLVGRQ